MKPTTDPTCHSEEAIMRSQVNCTAGGDPEDIYARVPEQLRPLGHSPEGIVVLPAFRDQLLDCSGRTGRGPRPVDVFRVWCAHCRDWHTHGAGGGHRILHCQVPDSPYRVCGYYIQEVGSFTAQVQRLVKGIRPKRLGRGGWK